MCMQFSGISFIPNKVSHLALQLLNREDYSERLEECEGADSNNRGDRSEEESKKERLIRRRTDVGVSEILSTRPEVGGTRAA